MARLTEVPPHLRFATTDRILQLVVELDGPVRHGISTFRPNVEFLKCGVVSQSMKLLGLENHSCSVRRHVACAFFDVPRPASRRYVGVMIANHRNQRVEPSSPRARQCSVVASSCGLSFACVEKQPKSSAEHRAARAAMMAWLMDASCLPLPCTKSTSSATASGKILSSDERRVDRSALFDENLQVPRMGHDCVEEENIVRSSRSSHQSRLASSERSECQGGAEASLPIRALMRVLYLDAFEDPALAYSSANMSQTYQTAKTFWKRWFIKEVRPTAAVSPAARISLLQFTLHCAAACFPLPLEHYCAGVTRR